MTVAGAVVLSFASFVAGAFFVLYFFVDRYLQHCGIEAQTQIKLVAAEGRAERLTRAIEGEGLADSLRGRHDPVELLAEERWLAQSEHALACGRAERLQALLKRSLQWIPRDNATALDAEIREVLGEEK